MNPLTNVRNIKKLSEAELKGRNKTSWHDQYRGSAWVFIGGLPFDLTEGDIICIFSQYGEPANINLVRDKATGKSKGFCFLCYEDQRSTNLAVDNLNGIKVLGRTLRVDHVDGYKPPKERKDDDETTRTLKRDGLAAAVKIHTVKKEEVSTVRVKVEKDIPIKMKSKTKKNKKRQSSETDESSEDEPPRRKKVKTEIKKIVKKKKRRSSSTSSSSSSTEDDSSSTEESDDSRLRKKKKKQKQKADNGKKLVVKQSKTIEELKREARLIQEELERRQKAKEGSVEKGNIRSKDRRKEDRRQEVDERRFERRQSQEREQRGERSDRHRPMIPPSHDKRQDHRRNTDGRSHREDYDHRHYEKLKGRSRSPEDERRKDRSLSRDRDRSRNLPRSYMNPRRSNTPPRHRHK